MKTKGKIAVVTGGASGLGLATAIKLGEAGAEVVVGDLPSSAGVEAAARIGHGARFVPVDVTSESDVVSLMDAAEEHGPLRILVHCAGGGGPLRIVDREGNPGSLEFFTKTIMTNLVGTFNTLRLAAATMASATPEDGERGVCVLTASVAAWEGQIGQVAYASSKAGVVGMTLVAARDLAGKQIRVCTIAPGLFDTPMLARVPDAARASLAESTPHPRRLGNPAEFGALAVHIIENAMLNGETIRLDGAIRLAPR